MDILTIENVSAMVILMVVIANSYRKALPCIILAFYVFYTTLDLGFASSGYVSDAPSWYLMMSVLDLAVMFACSLALALEKAYTRTTFIYIVYIALFHLIPDLAQANLIKTDFRYLSTAYYQYIMAYAIPFDILIAIIGSDNLVSRRIFTRS